MSLPFDKLRMYDSDDQRGVGLGLTICRGIVIAHGGRIWAENRSGGGTRFRFTLPLDGAPPAIAPEAGGLAEQVLP